jgi:hypothetical protein
MNFRNAFVSTLLVTLLFLTAAARTQDTLAQDDNGSISGAVFRDINENGLCTDEDEPGVVGIPLQLVNRDDNTIVNLTSGGEGFYELVDASMGTWQVTVNPGASWRVTSQQTQQAVVDEDEPDVEEIDFCIVQVTSATATNTPAPAPVPTQALVPTATPSPVLPESGAAVSPAILSSAVLGLLLLLLGAGLFVRARRGNGSD